MYAWTITKDHLADLPYGLHSMRDDAGTVGPSDATMDHDAIVAHAEGKKFRMFDDDGELNYEGVLVGGDGFEPLDDFGMPNAGATEIKYLEDGEWVTL